MFHKIRYEKQNFEDLVFLWDAILELPIRYTNKFRNLNLAHSNIIHHTYTQCSF